MGHMSNEDQRPGFSSCGGGGATQYRLWGVPTDKQTDTYTWKERVTEMEGQVLKLCDDEYQGYKTPDRSPRGQGHTHNVTSRKWGHGWSRRAWREELGAGQGQSKALAVGRARLSVLCLLPIARGDSLFDLNPVVWDEKQDQVTAQSRCTSCPTATIRHRHCWVLPCCQCGRQTELVILICFINYSVRSWKTLNCVCNNMGMWFIFTCSFYEI